MASGGLPLIEQLKQRMHWLQARQRLLAENVANANTPRFRPQDLRPFDTRGAMGLAVAPAQTAPGHLSLAAGKGAADRTAASRFETVPSGNAVTLEEEMTRLADTQADYQAAATLYSKSLSLLKIAIGKRV